MMAANTPPQIERRAVPAELYGALPAALDPVVRRVYAARGVAPGELNPALGQMIPVGAFAGAQRAAEVLADARRSGRGIVVVGDFDADGATASALVVTCLRGMGYERVGFLVPNRFETGYGLAVPVVEQAAARGAGLIVTVDNGVTSVEGVARAGELGIDVVVTDHHLPGPVLPAARVVANPNLPDEPFPGKSLAGVGVAFYVMAALARELERRSIVAGDVPRRAVADCLDLVALGTVADLVRLDHNNRVLVSEGLRRMRAGRARPGIQALFAVAGRAIAGARAADLGFGVAPRLNAAGRLTDMTVGIECLLAADAGTAHRLAAQLDALNAARQDLQGRMQQEAILHLGERLAADPGAVVCLFDPGWHEGIVGLVASRVKEATGRPAVVLAPSERPGELKGSARSVEGLHIRDLLADVARRVPEVVFGGHAMAAGVRLPQASLDAFRAALAAEAARALADLPTGRVLWTDGPLAAGETGIALAEQLQFGVPWGQGFPEPRFDNAFGVVDQRVLRDAHLKLRVRHADGGEVLDAIAFNQAAAVGDAVRLIYRLDVNEYAGRRRAQLVVDHVASV